MLIIYLLVGLVGWCVFYGINVRTGRFGPEPDEFFLGLVMMTAFWPVAIAGIIVFWIVAGLYILVTGGRP